MEFSMEKAKELLSGRLSQAEEVLKDAGKVDDLLKRFETKLKDIPFAGSVLADIPLMVQMIKSNITKEYKTVSPKVIALLVGAILYLVTNKDLIPDSVPVAGHIDDIAVFTLALKLAEPELKAYAAWRDAGKPEQTFTEEADAAPETEIELPEGMPEEA